MRLPVIAAPAGPGLIRGIDGAVVIIPVIPGYTAWSSWVFRGKTGTGGCEWDRPRR